MNTYAPSMLYILTRRALSASLLIFIAFSLINFPTAKVLLSVGFILYFLGFQYYPQCWLMIIPALLPLFYLTPYSGRLFFDEFDFLIIVTSAAFLWRNPSMRHPQESIPTAGRLILASFCLLYFISLLIGLFPLEEFDLNINASYHSHLNSLRIGKGLFWALCIYPIWKATKSQFPERCEKLFSFGILLGSLGTFFVMLWERGVFHDLFYADDRYALINSFLNFHTAYRATGLFAEMHTGGTATDGYLILALPLLGFFLTCSRNKVQLGLGFFALFGAIYSIAITFSRGVYLGVGIIFILLLAYLYLTNRHKTGKLTFPLSLLYGIVLFFTGLYSFRYGGIYALSGVLLAFLGSLIFPDHRYRFPLWAFFSILGMLVILCFFLVFYGIFSSEWNETATLSGLFITLLVLSIATAVGFFTGKTWIKFSYAWQRLLVACITCTLLGVFIPSVFGYRMETRLTTVSDDFRGRIAHWANAVSIMDNDLTTTLLGQGIGRFPDTNYRKKNLANSTGSYSFKQPGVNYIAFKGSPDLRLSQRISLAPKTHYTLTAKVRTADASALLQLRLCHRQLINPTEWNPSCWMVREVVKNTQGQWRTLQFAVRTDQQGSFASYLRAPLVFTFTNRRDYDFKLKSQTVLDIANLSIKNAAGEEFLQNGAFDQGIDHWYAYYDFNHLPWHIKNLWVGIYFDTGLLGLISFMLLIAYVLTNSLIKALQKNYFAGAGFLCIIGFLTVGSFGTLLDAPRVAFLFYFLVLVNMSLVIPIKRQKQSTKKYISPNPRKPQPVMPAKLGNTRHLHETKFSGNVLNRQRITFSTTLFYFALVVYGSLLPFELRDLSLHSAIANFSNIRYLPLGINSRADWVANILLYIPLTYFAAATFIRHNEPFLIKAIKTILLVGLISFLAAGIEFLQLFFAPRTVSLNDLQAEFIGMVLGMLCWHSFSRHIADFSNRWFEFGTHSLRSLLIFYAVAYLLYNLFPFDFIQSLDEIKWKISQGHSGIFFAPGINHGLKMTVLTSLVEFMAMAPVGALFYLYKKNSPSLYLTALVFGILLAILLESLQFLIGSGISQGYSVLVRTIGFLGGIYLAQHINNLLRAGIYLARLKSMQILIICLSCLFPLWISWAGNTPWISPQEALIKLDQTSFLPFYYYYFTSETRAVQSLVMNFLLYSPIAVIFWIKNRLRSSHYPIPGRIFALCAGVLLAVIVETGKLFLHNTHTDPSNVLVSLVAIYLIYGLCNHIGLAYNGIIAERAKPSDSAFRFRL